MHILYLSSVRIPNEKASGLAIMKQCEAFVAIGHTVTLLRPYRKNHIVAEPFAYYGMEKSFAIKTMCSINFIETLSVFGFYLTRLSQMCASFFYIMRHRTEIDIVYARDPWLLVLLSWFPVKPYFWEAHQKQPGFFIERVGKKAQKMICISSGLKEFYTPRVSRGIEVVPSGVNLEQFKVVPTVAEVRTSLTLPLDKKIIGYIGKYSTMGETKGMSELIQAFAAVRKTNTEAHLMLVGLEASEIAEVEKMCKEAGLTPLDFSLLSLDQKEFSHYTQAADILVMNYPNTEHYQKYMSPTKLFAYMASGKPVIASDLPSIREIADENAIIFVTPDSVPALSEALLTTLKSPSETLNRLTTTAKTVVEKYSWTNRAKVILN